MGLAGRAPTWLALDGAVQRPAGAGLAGRPAGEGPGSCWAPHDVGGEGRGPRPERETGGLSEAAARARAPACGSRGAGAPRLQPGLVSGPWSPAGVRQPRPGPSYLGGGRVKRGPATLGDRASGKPTTGIPGPEERSTEAGLAGLFSERGSGLRAL